MDGTEKPLLYLVLVTGVIGPRKWLGCSWDESNDGPLYFLSKKFPDARIKVFSATEKPHQSVGESSIHFPDLRQRAADLLRYIDNDRRQQARDDPGGMSPTLIFAGHDVGGIVVKQALVTASSEAHFSWVANGTSAALFFETPYIAPNQHAWERDILQMLALSEANLDFISFLRCLPPFAGQLEEEFQDLLGSYYTVNFYAKTSPLLPTSSADHQSQSTRYHKTELLDCDAREIWLIRGGESAAESICQVISDRLSSDLKDDHEDSRHLLRSPPEIDPEWYLARSSVDWPISPSFNDWIFETQWYSHWIENADNNVLHIVGPGGSGIMALTYKILRYLRRNGNLVLVYSMLSTSERTRDSGESPSRSLFHSLCQQMLQILFGSQARLALCSWLVKEHLYTKEALKGLLYSLLSSYAGDPLFFIIHGVHILSPHMQKQLFKDFEMIMASLQVTLKLLITGNVQQDWNKMPEPYAVVHLLEEQEKHKVMRLLATARIENLARSRPMWRQPKQKECAINKLCSESATMFELSRKLDLIESANTPETTFDVESMITNIPQSLEETIDAIFQTRIESQSLASAALAWILFSSRPLSLSELSVCIAMGTTSETALDLGSLRSKISWNPQRDVRLALGTVIHISGDKAIIRHQSYIHVLRSRPYLRISEDPHLFLLLECLKYLELIGGCWKESIADPIENGLKREVLLAEYGAVHWPDHCFLACDKHEATVKVFDFLQNPERFNLWLSMLRHYYHYAAPRDAKLRLPESPVEVACYFGLQEVVDKFLEQTPFSECLTKQLTAGLDFASEKGYVTIVEHILAKDIRSPNALRKAAQFGQTKILQALVSSQKFDIEDKDDTGYNPLLEASWGGHLETITFLLDQKANVNVKNHSGLTPLHLACRIGQGEVAAKLIRFNTPITPQDEAGYTALMYAAEAGFNHILQALMSALRERNPDVVTAWSPAIELNRSTAKGDTALHLAVSGGHQNTVELLLRMGASPEIKNNIYYTPLHLAAKSGFLGIAKALIQSSSITADEDTTTESQASLVAESPLGLAVRNQHHDVIRELLYSKQHRNKEESFRAVSYACEAGYLDSVLKILQWHRDSESEDCGPLQNEDGATALHLAIDFGHLKLVEDILVGKLVPIDSTGRDNWTPLHAAAKGGDVEIINVLLNWRAGLMNTTVDGKTALHIAAEYGHKEACKALLRLNNGNLARMKSNDGCLPVVLAARENHLDVVKELLCLDPDTAKEGLLHSTVQHSSEELLDLVLAVKPELDWIDENGNTAVHLAVSDGKVSMVQKLHKAGASMSLQAPGGKTPLFCAIETKNLDMVKALLALDANLEVDKTDTEGLTPLLAACIFFFQNPEVSTEVVRALLEKFPNMDVNIAHPVSGKTPLHYSTDTDTEELTMLLLEAGAKPNIRNQRGSTPIFLAAEMGKSKSVEALIRRGAEVSIQNNSKTTPLHRAAGNNYPECITVLARHGADVNVVSTWGYTPLTLAIINGYTDCIKALLEYNVDLTTKNDDGLTPLALAAESDVDDAVDMLIEVMQPTDVHQAIHGAVVGGYVDAVNILTHKIDNLNIDDEMYGSLLGVAVAKERNGIAQILLNAANIKVDCRDPVGRTPLMMAVILDDLAMVQALIKAGANPNTRDYEDGWPLFNAIIQRNSEIVQYLVSLDNIDLRQVDGRGHGALYWACRQSNDEIFGIINNATRELSEYKSICELAIHAAVASSNDKALDSLLEVQGVDTNVADSDGWTPLYTAKCYEVGSLEEKLVKSGGKAETELTLETPTSWHKTDRASGLSADKNSPNTVEVKRTVWTLRDSATRYGIARADHPLRGDEDWYFEVKIKQSFKGGRQLLGVGLCEDNVERFQMLGFSGGISFGYHADDGNPYPDHWPREMEAGETYGQDDVIGCGYKYDIKSVYFTHNGVFLGQAFKDIKGKFYPAVFMDTREIGVSILANFVDTSKWEFDPKKPQQQRSKSPGEQSERTTSPPESPEIDRVSRRRRY